MLNINTLRHHFSFLRLAPDEVLEALSRYGVSRSFDPDTRIYWEGDTCSHIAFITEGEIRVFKSSDSGREITLYEIGPGETCILNASCILSDMKYPADAITLTRVKALLIPANIFDQLIEKHSAVRNYIFTLLSKRLVSVFELLEDVVFGQLDKRLNDYLVEKAENDILMTTHNKIAHDLGSSREVISRLLKDMERKDQVKITRGKIKLLTL